MCQVSPIRHAPDSGPRHHPGSGSCALLIRRRSRRGWRSPESTYSRSPPCHLICTVPSLLARLPLRAARWSATHPWRAIGAWFAFVAIAVALAALIPTKQTTDADYRLGESGRADAMAAAGRFADDQVESVLVTAPRRRFAVDPTEVTPGPQSCSPATSPASTASPRWPTPQWNAGRTAALINVHLKSTVDDASQIQARTAAIARAHAGAPASARPATSRSTPPSTTASPRTCTRPRGSACRSPCC